MQKSSLSVVRVVFLTTLAGATAAFAACGGSETTPPSSTTDAGLDATTTTDGSSSDSGVVPADSATSDTGATDAGAADTGTDTGTDAGADAADACAPLQGIVAWYRGDSDPTDSFANHEGTWLSVLGDAGTAAYAAGKVGMGFDFASTTSHVRVADDSELDLTNAMTIEAWVHVNSAGATGRIVDKITAGASNGYLLDVLGGRLRMIAGPAHALNRVTATDAGAAMALPTGEFVHVAGTYALGELKLYVNGVEATDTVIGVLDAGSPVNALPVRIGIDSTNAANRFPGIIDEVGIFNRALTPAEIAELVARGSAGRCPYL